mmetsp:Transcript_44485/g.100215  ORF Transcript_44485/g.100215 Transcript_44485/m.100215 type:complete len:226 (+) Transcript_44485:1270-1947(+)
MGIAPAPCSAGRMNSCCNEAPSGVCTQHPAGTEMLAPCDLLPCPFRKGSSNSSSVSRTLERCGLLGLPVQGQSDADESSALVPPSAFGHFCKSCCFFFGHLRGPMTRPPPPVVGSEQASSTPLAWCSSNNVINVLLTANSWRASPVDVVVCSSENGRPAMRSFSSSGSIFACGEHSRASAWESPPRPRARADASHARASFMAGTGTGAACSAPLASTSMSAFEGG